MNKSVFKPRLLAAAITLAFLGQAQAAELAAATASEIAATQRFDIPASSLADSLSSIARQSGQTIVADPELVNGKTAPAVNGRYTAKAAIEKALAGSGLQVITTTSGGFTLKALPIITGEETSTLPEVPVKAQVEQPSDLPTAYAGGQVAKGGRVGMLGNKSVMDTPFNVTHYTAEVIENQQAITVADVLANDPSVRVTTSGLTSAAGQGDGFFIRGFKVNSKDVAFDGVYGIAPSTLVPVEVMERVELLKGPNALLNGMGPSGGVGGAINVIPKRADDAPLTRLTALYSSKSQFGGHVDIGRRFGEDNRWGVRFNGIYRDGDTSFGGQSTELGVATIALDFRGDRLRATVDAGYQDLITKAPTGAAGVYILDGLAIPKAPRADKQMVQDWEVSKTKSDYLLTKLEYDITPQWMLYGALGTSSNKSRWLASDTYVVDAQGNAQGSVYQYLGYTERNTAQAGLRGTFHTGVTRHDINLNAAVLKQETGYSFGDADGYGYGFSSFNTNIYNASSVAKPSLAGFSSHVPKGSEITLPTFAIADTLSWLEGRIAVTLGARYQQVKTDNYDTLTGAKTPGYNESAVTPALALLVKPVQNLSLYANYIEGLSQGDTAPPGTTNAGSVFPPAKTKQMEVGAKYDFGRFTATASVFQIEQPSALRVRDAATNRTTYKLDGEQRNKGIELNVFGEAMPGVRLLGGIAYTDARMTRTENGINDGKTVIAIPRLQANLGAEWDPVLLSGVTLTARMISTDSQYQNADNTRSIPGWTRWDAGARYKTLLSGRPLIVRANIENLFNRDYWMTATEGWLNQGAPRVFRLSATMDF